MNNKSIFTVEVAGIPLQYESVDRFRRLLERILIKEDPDVRYDEISFARLYYKLSWEGCPGDMYYLTMVHRKIIEKAGEYLEKWSYRIKVKIKDKGEGK